MVKMPPETYYRFWDWVAHVSKTFFRVTNDNIHQWYRYFRTIRGPADTYLRLAHDMKAPEHFWILLCVEACDHALMNLLIEGATNIREAWQTYGDNIVLRHGCDYEFQHRRWLMRTCNAHLSERIPLGCGRYGDHTRRAIELDFDMDSRLSFSERANLIRRSWVPTLSDLRRALQDWIYRRENDITESDDRYEGNEDD